MNNRKTTNISYLSPTTPQQYQKAIIEMIKSINDPQELKKIYILTNYIAKK